MIKFSPANIKLRKLEKKLGKIYSFDLISGHNCPFAHKCLSKVVKTPEGLRIQDGKHTEFRCYSASQEVLYSNVYRHRIGNFQALKGLSKERMVARIEAALPKCDVVRIHSSGDFFSQEYFDAWIQVSKRNHQRFYAYTKSLPYWVRRLNEIPENLILTASYGGRRDDLIEKYNLRYAKVVYSREEAEELGLEIDIDDSHASMRGGSFALLIHNSQPKGSLAAIALHKLRRKS